MERRVPSTSVTIAHRIVTHEGRNASPLASVGEKQRLEVVQKPPTERRRAPKHTMGMVSDESGRLEFELITLGS